MFVPVILLMIIEGDIENAETRLSAEQQCDNTEHLIGDEVNIRYTFKNSGRLLFATLVQDFPDAFHVSAIRHSFWLRGKRSINITIRLTEGGIFRIPPPRVLVSDMFRISVRTVEFGVERELTVLQSVGKIRTRLFRPLSYRMLPGNIVSRYAGSGFEFHSVVRYIEGQAVRHVNWKASARFDDLWVNEFISERSGTLLIILDGKMIDRDEEITGKFTSRASFAASSIAYSAVRERNAVGIIVVGEKVHRIKPDYGFRQFQRILQLLTSLGVSSRPSPVQIDRAAAAYGHSYAQFVVVSPLANEETLDSIASLALNYRDVWTIVPLIFGKASASTGVEIAGELLRLRQQNNAIRLSRVCRTLIWDQNADFQSTVESAANAAVRRMH